MSEGRRAHRKEKASYPVAKGFAPPPAQVRQLPDVVTEPERKPARPAPPPLPPQETVRLEESNAPRFALGDAGGRLIVPRSDHGRERKPASLLFVQVLVVAVLVAGCMAAGWWLRHKASIAPLPSNEMAANEPSKPAAPLAVEAPKPAPAVEQQPRAPEKPAEKIASPNFGALTQPRSPEAAPTPSRPPAPTPAPPRTPEPKPIPPPPQTTPTTTLTFQKDILPILQSKCVVCHGDKNKVKGGLDVRTLASLEKGGESGPGIDREKPQQSQIWEQVTSDQMPPGKPKLSDTEKKKLHDWLVGGGK